MTGVELIAAERKRQIEEEGFTAEHDDMQKGGQLASAAAYYAVRSDMRIWLKRLLWPWPDAWRKPTPDNRIRELEKAGALIAAEIDRLQRLENKKENSND
jgi:hypothetical protein